MEASEDPQEKYPQSESDEDTIQEENEEELDRIDNSDPTVTIALTQEHGERQEAKETDNPDVIEGPRTRNKGRRQTLPTITVKQKVIPDKEEDPQDKHPARPPTRRSLR